MLNMAEQLDDQEVRWMTAMWADTALHQMVRFEEAIDTYAAAWVNYEFREPSTSAATPQSGLRSMPPRANT